MYSKCKHKVKEHLGGGDYRCLNRKCKKIIHRKLQKWEVERNERSDAVAASTESEDQCLNKEQLILIHTNKEEEY